MSKNDVTGDEIKTKVTTDKFRDGHDRIFGKKPVEIQENVEYDNKTETKKETNHESD